MYCYESVKPRKPKSQTEGTNRSKNMRLFPVNYPSRLSPSVYLSRLMDKNYCQETTTRTENSYASLNKSSSIDAIKSNCFILDEDGLIVTKTPYYETSSTRLYDLPDHYKTLRNLSPTSIPEKQNRLMVHKNIAPGRICNDSPSAFNINKKCHRSPQKWMGTKFFQNKRSDSSSPPPQREETLSRKRKLKKFRRKKKFGNQIKDLNDSCGEPLPSKPGETDLPSPPSPFTAPPLPTMEIRSSTAVKFGRNSPSVFCMSSLGRVSPGHDLGYHTLVSRQTPTPTPPSNRDRTTTPSLWSDIRASPFPSRDLSNLSSCPRSSPRPQLPQIPVHQPADLESTEQLLAAYKAKRVQKSYGDRLSDELILKIFSYLPTNSLCQCARVCRKWYQLAWSPQLWNTISLSGDMINADKAIKQITKLLAKDSSGYVLVEKVILNNCTRLTDRGLQLIAKKCCELRYLDVKGCTNITNSGVLDIATLCVNLDHIDLAGCSNITCINVDPQNSMELESLHSRQLYLQYIDMTDCYDLQDIGLKIIVKNCPQLIHLYLRRCINLTDVGVKYISSYCLMLREVSISDCLRVTDFGMYELAKLGPNLRYLSVAKCDQVSDAGIKQIARQCYKLRYLNVRGCEAVSDDSMEMVARSCPRLRALDIGKCDVTDNGMKFISEHCPNLKKLSAKSCDMITDRGIQFIAYYCRGLQQLNIQDCQVTIEGYRTVKKYCRRCIIEHTNPGFY